ncbi:MAG TPA: hypothetical protein VMH30_01735 [Verrucomicrobiae bacterium]|nr:hypothetical protein [Verrucomicrobiae bacterium]
MTDFELESKLKAVRVPGRAPEYWEDFPSRVRAELPARAMQRPHQTAMPRWAWAGGLALACALFAFVIVPGVQTAVKDGRMLHREMAQLPEHLRVLMADEHGLHYLIADQK